MSHHAQALLPGDMPGGCDLCRNQGGLPGLPSIAAQCLCGAVGPAYAPSRTVIVRYPNIAPPRSPWVVMSYAEAIYRLQADGRLDIYTKTQAEQHLATMEWDSRDAYQMNNAMRVAWPGGSK